MDKGVVAEKLDSLFRCVKRIESKRPISKDALVNDPDLQDIIAINLERAVQLAVDIGTHTIANSTEHPPSTMGEVFVILENMKVIQPSTAKRMCAAVGFRNISVHSYEKINWAIVYSIITDNLDDFRLFARDIDDFLQLKVKTNR
jgi:uncharacterized protein YutE (UPF0331/DUF86 family)